MRVLDGDQFLVRIFLGESDRWRDRNESQEYESLGERSRIDALSVPGRRTR